MSWLWTCCKPLLADSSVSGGRTAAFSFWEKFWVLSGGRFGFACASRASREMRCMHAIQRVTTTDSCTFTGTVSHCNAMQSPGFPPIHPHSKVQGCLLFNVFSSNTGRSNGSLTHWATLYSAESEWPYTASQTLFMSKHQQPCCLANAWVYSGVRHGAKDNYWQPVIRLTLRCCVITQPHSKISMRRCALRPQGALCHRVITTFLARPSPLSRDRGGICNANGASRKKKLSIFNISTRFIPNLAPQLKHCGPHKAFKRSSTLVWYQRLGLSKLFWSPLSAATNHTSNQSDMKAKTFKYKTHKT